MVLHSLKILGYCNLLKGSKHERLLFPRSKWRSPMHSLIQEISHRPVKHFFYKLFTVQTNWTCSIVWSHIFFYHFFLLDTQVHNGAKAIITVKKCVLQKVEKSLECWGKPEVSKWQFKLRMPKVWRKKQRLKPLPAESQRYEN